MFEKLKNKSGSIDSTTSRRAHRIAPEASHLREPGEEAPELLERLDAHLPVVLVERDVNEKVDKVDGDIERVAHEEQVGVLDAVVGEVDDAHRADQDDVGARRHGQRLDEVQLSFEDDAAKLDFC